MTKLNEKLAGENLWSASPEIKVLLNVLLGQFCMSDTHGISLYSVNRAKSTAGVAIIVDAPEAGRTVFIIPDSALANSSDTDDAIEAIGLKLAAKLNDAYRALFNGREVHHDPGGKPEYMVSAGRGGGILRGMKETEARVYKGLKHKDMVLEGLPRYPHPECMSCDKSGAWVIDSHWTQQLKTDKRAAHMWFDRIQTERLAAVEAIISEAKAETLDRYEGQEEFGQF